MEWIGTAVAIAVVVVLIASIIAGRILAIKKGKSICGGDCGSCHGGCSHGVGAKDIDKERPNVGDMRPAGNLYEITLEIDGMMCGMCEAHICSAIREHFQVKKVKASYQKGIAMVTAPLAIMEEEFNSVLEPTGYRIISYRLRKL